MDVHIILGARYRHPGPIVLLSYAVSAWRLFPPICRYKYRGNVTYKQETNHSGEGSKTKAPILEVKHATTVIHSNNHFMLLAHGSWSLLNLHNRLEQSNAFHIHMMVAGC